MRQPQDVSLDFPLRGLDVNSSKRRQPPGSSVDLLNTRGYDQDGRARGGSRPGLAKYCSAIMGASGRIQCLHQVATPATASSSQTALTARLLQNMAIRSGIIYSFTTTAATGANAADGVARLDANAPVIFAASLYNKVYVVDGTYAAGKNTIVWDAAANTTTDWKATLTAGSFPSSGTDYPRLICSWRGRIVLSGIKSDPSNWFMTATGSPLNFDYSPAVVLESQAISGNTPEIGKVPQIVNCLLPYSDDILIFGADHSIWQMTGDPMAGGRVDLVSGVTGMAWGEPYCKSPNGTIYFMGATGGLYSMSPGSRPERMSAARIESRLDAIDMDSNLVRLVWNDRTPGFHAFITSLTASDSDLHYFWDARLDAFFPDQHGHRSLNPVTVLTIDGDNAEDRDVLIGCQDGYVRRFSDTATDDDVAGFQSYCMIGPISVQQEELPFVLSEIRTVLRAGSGDLDYAIFIGNSSETASDAAGLLITINGVPIGQESGNLVQLSEGNHLAAHSRGTLVDVRSATVFPRARGYAVYIKLYARSANIWNLESLSCRLSAIVSSRGRKL